MSDDREAEDVMAPIKSATPEVRQIITEVLKLEHESIYMERPRVHDDIVRIIKNNVSAGEAGGDAS